MRRAARASPASADVHHALGLSLVRQKRTREGVEELRLAAHTAPDNPRYSYVYAVALNSTGEPERAITTLEDAHDRHPNDLDILRALAAFHRDAGNRAKARIYAERLHSMSR